MAAWVVGGGVGQAAPPADAKPVDLVLEDQFGRKQDVAALRGDVAVLVYGDRGGTDACRELGSKLHVLFHPDRRGAAGRAGADGPGRGLARGAGRQTVAGRVRRARRGHRQRAGVGEKT